MDHFYITRMTRQKHTQLKQIATQRRVGSTAHLLLHPLPGPDMPRLRQVVQPEQGPRRRRRRGLGARPRAEPGPRPAPPPPRPGHRVGPGRPAQHAPAPPQIHAAAAHPVQGRLTWKADRVRSWQTLQRVAWILWHAFLLGGCWQRRRRIRVWRLLLGHLDGYIP